MEQRRISVKIEAPLSPEAEFSALTKIIKDNIKIMISYGDYEHAKITLRRYAQLCPGDEDITILRRLLRYSRRIDSYKN